MSYCCAVLPSDVVVVVNVVITGRGAPGMVDPVVKTIFDQQ
jgi:hypothetical protein